MIPPPDPAIIREAAARALGEDRGPVDITTRACVGPEMRASARIFAKEACVIAGVEIVRSGGKLTQRRIDIVLWSLRILHRMSRDVIPHRDRSVDRRTCRAAVGKKRTRFLKFHLILAFHVAKKFDGRDLPMFSLKTEQRDRDDRQEDESDQKNLNHSRKAE